MSVSKKDKDEDNISGRFDPTALERGAKALKDLDASPNATKAFELTKMQEITKQKELELQNEQMQTQRSQMNLQRAQVEGEEKRKTSDHTQEQERRTMQYKAQLESELYQKKLDDQQKQNEQWLQQQHQQFLQHEQQRKQNDLELEEQRRRTIEFQSKLDRETAATKVAAETEGRIKEGRENVDIHLREMRAKASEERKTKLESLQLGFSSVGSAFRTLLEDKTKLTSLAFGITAIAAGIYSARAGAKVGGNLLEKHLSKPPLVRETSRWTWSKGLANFKPSAKMTNIYEKIVLHKELEERLAWTTNSLINAKKNGTPFRHLLLYGPPGTGKTLFARTLSQQSGLDYAIMTGGDIGPLGKDAVDEVNKMFAWANKSNKGMILFVDEADAFLRTGRQSANGISEEARNVLSAFLHHTGTESDKFMVVLATNCREILDRAVLDRIDENFEFPRPEMEQRVSMLKQFMNEYIHQPTKKGRKIEVEDGVNDEYLTKIAERTAGFSGRQLAKLVIAYQAAVFGSGTNKLTVGLADTILNWKLAHFEQDIDVIEAKRAEEDKKKFEELN